MTRKKAAQILDISYNDIERVRLGRCRAEFSESPGYLWDALQLAIAALREQPRWISVEERLPEESTEVLSFFCVRKIDGTWERYTATAIRLCDAKWLVSDYQNGIEAYSWGTDIEDCCFRVTHWMPLPEPPKEEV